MYPLVVHAERNTIAYSDPGLRRSHALVYWSTANTYDRARETLNSYIWPAKPLMYLSKFDRNAKRSFRCLFSDITHDLNENADKMHYQNLQTQVPSQETSAELLSRKNRTQHARNITHTGKTASGRCVS